MSAEIKGVLICARVKVAKHIARGSINARCRRCRDRVWIAPSGRKKVTEGFVILCDGCYAREVKRDPSLNEQVRVSKESLAEVVDYFMRRSDLN